MTKCQIDQNPMYYDSVAHACSLQRKRERCGPWASCLIYSLSSWNIYAILTILYFLRRNLQDKILEMKNNMGINDKPWKIKVVRRMFETTSIEQLEDGDEQDWERPLSIHFIGEEGIDAWGLTREFFSILFKSTKVFEGNTFSVNPQLLDSKQYSLIGKAVAKAIMSGHPGPRCLNQHVARYIILGKEPDFASSCQRGINIIW